MRSTLLLNMRSHTHDHVISRLDLLDLTSRELKQTKKACDHITSFQTKRHYLSKNEKYYSLIERYFAKPAQNTACTLINLALKTATRNNKKFPSTQQETAQLCGKSTLLATLPGCFKNAMVWLHWLFLFFSFLYIQLRVCLNNLLSCLSRQAKIVPPRQEIYPLPVLPF